MNNDVREDIASRAKFPKRHVVNARNVGNTESQAWHDKAALVAGFIRAKSLTALIGTRGGGKTQLATSVALELMPELFKAQQHNAVIYRTAQDIFRQVRSCYTRGSDTSDAEIVNRLVDTQLLVIDEIHERGQTAFEDRLLVEIIDKRYGAMLPTLIIGNLKPEEFAKQLGPSIADRCREGGGIVVLDGPSHRAQPTTLEKLQ